MEPVMLTLLLLLVAVVLFATEWLPADVTGLLLLCALMLSGLLEPDRALLHFGDSTVLTLAALFVLSRMLQRTGVIDWLSRAALRGNVWLTGKRKPPSSEVAAAEGMAAVRRLLTGAAGVSAFTSNTATTAVFLPVLDAVAHRSGLPVSRVLMPLAFASILGGSITLIGTSTNLVVSGFLPELGLERFGFFELAWVGLPLAVSGLLYLYFVAPKLLPDRASAAEQQLRAFISDLTVTANSPLVGKTLQQSRLGRVYGLTVVAVKREEGQTVYAPEASFLIQAGDTLAVEGDSEAVLRAKTTLGLMSRSAQNLPLSGLEAQVRLVEAVVMPGSELLGRTLREARFRERYGLSVLALHRRESTVERLAGLRIRVGDVLLIQGAENRLSGLGEGFAVLAGDDLDLPPPAGKAPLALVLFFGALLLGGLGVVPLVVALLTAVALAFALQLIDPSEAYRAIEWPVLVLVAAMLAFGEAFWNSGAADMAAAWASGVLGPLAALGPLGGVAVLAGVYLLTLLLTQSMSNPVAALVMLPLAVGVAHALGFDARPFVVTVALAASNSFLTPLEPSCMLVYGPGHYRFADFLRVGGGLTLITFVLTLVLVPLVWPL